MSYTIAICGKGGTGKTTFAALLIKWLLDNQAGKSILAIDADPNANLDCALGVSSENSIVSIVDQMGEDPDRVPKGMTKDKYLDYQIQEALIESSGFDLLSMGRPEGPGCYCAVNNLLRSLIKRLTKNYSYIVIDNEAGMEHLSRRTTRVIDLLFLVSDYSLVGLRSAKRIADLTKELKLKVKDTRLVINRATKDVKELQSEIDKLGVRFSGAILGDDAIGKLAVAGESVFKLKADSKTKQTVSKICKEAL